MSYFFVTTLQVFFCIALLSGVLWSRNDPPSLRPLTWTLLTGLIAGLMAQGCPAFDATAMACWLAGRGAERLARRGTGPIGLTASETAQAARAELNRWLHPASG